jgi:lipopolysaccharide/colanic/teichoic acid biosynthesis glycosyltransferase
MIDPRTGDCTTVVDPFLLGRVGNRSDTPSRFQRMLNVCGAVLLLLILSPALIVAWLAAVAGSGAQYLDRSTRVGQRIRRREPNSTLATFELLQFRLRRPDGRYALLGRWLERTELYRLPELINVLRGEMDLVGVKPLRAAEVSQLNDDWQQKRHEVAPGFTGMWYHDTYPSSPLDTVIVADVYYVATRSWHEDLRLLLQTPSIWLRRQSLARSRSSDADPRAQADTIGGM